MNLRIRDFRAVAFLLFATGLCTLVPRSASATYVADWYFNDPIQTAGQFDTVTMEATLVNVSTGGEHIVGDDITVATFYYGTLAPTYSFSFGSIFAQFVGLDLAPGESLGFTFGTLTPVAPPAAYGVYSSPRSVLNINGLDVEGGTFEVEVVPEPGTMLLLGSGILALAARRRRTP